MPQVAALYGVVVDPKAPAPRPLRPQRQDKPQAKRGDGKNDRPAGNADRGPRRDAKSQPPATGSKPAAAESQPAAAETQTAVADPKPETSSEAPAPVATEQPEAQVDETPGVPAQDSAETL
jgi:hypothetical protein